MKNRILVVFLFIICCNAIINAKENVAVYLAGQKEEEDPVKNFFGDRMVSYITQSDDYIAVERTLDFIKALRAEYDYMTSGEVSDEQIAKYGKQFGAQLVAIIKVSEIYGELSVSARLINVEDNAVMQTYNAYSKVNTMDELAKLANNVADGLILAPGRKIQEKIDAERRAQHEKEEAEKRVQQEKEEAMNRARQEREAAEREQELLARLREQAIKNLTPDGCIISGRYIVQTSAIPVQFSGQGSNVRANVTIPYGFRMASLGELSELFNNGISWYNINIILNKEVYSSYDKIIGYEYKMNVFYNGQSSNISVGFADKKGGFENLIGGNGVFAVAVKNAPSEYEIQSEIKRLRSYY